jgi:two-component system cell cycle response regulator DivK
METPNEPIVLIVDDFGDALEIYQQYLTFRGYRVLVASTGLEAIATARAEHPALIFMDLRMSEMSGTDAMRQLRADPAFSFVPIVALTAHAFADEQAAALAAGFDEVIPKPCNPDDLILAIERLLSPARQQPS